MSAGATGRVLLAGIVSAALAGSASAQAPAPHNGKSDALAGVKTRAEIEQIDVLARAGAVPPELSRELFARDGAAYSIDTSYFANRVQTPQLHLTYDEVFVV